MFVSIIKEISMGHRLYNSKLSNRQNYALYGKCSNPNGHGHNYVIELTVKGEVDARTGMVLSLDSIKSIFNREITEKFDHKFLNYDLKEFKNTVPTSENIAKLMWEKLENKFSPAELHRILIKESRSSYFEYFGG